MFKSIYAPILLCLLATQTSYSQMAVDTVFISKNQLIAVNISSVYGAPIDTVNRFIREARELEKKFGVPATAVIGIALLESHGFTSYLYLNSNNPFGIKATKTWKGETFDMMHEEAMTPFRLYEDIPTALTDFVAKLRSRRWFQDALKCPRGDFECFITGMMPAGKNPGWAADPEWGPKVFGLIKRFELDTLE